MYNMYINTSIYSYILIFLYSYIHIFIYSYTYICLYFLCTPAHSACCVIDQTLIIATSLYQTLSLLTFLRTYWKPIRQPSNPQAAPFQASLLHTPWWCSQRRSNWHSDVDRCKVSTAARLPTGRPWWYSGSSRNIGASVADSREVFISSGEPQRSLSQPGHIVQRELVGTIIQDFMAHRIILQSLLP